MDFKNSKVDMDGGFPREILETDKCDWCREKKAVIIDGAYVYCSEDCKELFIDNAQDAIAKAFLDAMGSDFNKE